MRACRYRPKSSDTPRALARLCACASGRMHIPTAATASTTASADGARRPRVKPKNASGSDTTAAAAISALLSDATMASSAIFACNDGSTIRAAAIAAALAISSARYFATAATKPMARLARAGVLGGEGAVAQPDRVVNAELVGLPLHADGRQRNGGDVALDLAEGGLRENDLARLRGSAQARGDVDGVADRRVLQRARAADRARDNEARVDADADRDLVLAFGGAGAVPLREHAHHVQRA